MNSISILEALDDPLLFKPLLPMPDWRAGRVLLASLFGLPLDDADTELFRTLTARSVPQSKPAREGWFVIGRRGGKSRLAALVAVYLACFRDYRHLLAPGEVPTLAVVAGDRRQARVVFNYIVGFLEAVPFLRAMIVSRARERILLSNNVAVEIHTASWRTRGPTYIGFVADEAAFLPTDDAANPLDEILTAVRPGMSTIPGALLICISSPWARRGAFWEAYRQHYSKDNDPILVVQADTATMNPRVDPQVIADAYERDEVAASAEYGALFRRDIEAYVSREAVDAVVIRDRLELPRTQGVGHLGFVDPSGGSVDSMTLAIAHRDREGRAVLDLVRERKPPFSPDDVTAEFAATLKLYGCHSVTGDKYAGEWPRERFRMHGCTYVVADKTRSELYRDLLPLLNSQRVELLDDKKLINQLCALERRTARSGKDSIDHAPGAHDDVINAAAGALVSCAVQQNQAPPLIPIKGLGLIGGPTWGRR